MPGRIHRLLQGAVPLALAGAVLAVPSPAAAAITDLVGWATVNGGTTGGGSAATTTVTSASALTTALASTSAANIRVSGTITLRKGLGLTSPYVTIAGQSAPGGGITLRVDPCSDDAALGIYTHDVVVRHLRVRRGPNTCGGEGDSGV